MRVYPGSGTLGDKIDSHVTAKFNVHCYGDEFSMRVLKIETNHWVPYVPAQ